MISPGNKPDVVKTREPEVGPWPDRVATRDEAGRAANKPSAVISVPEGFDASVVVVTPAMTAPSVRADAEVCDLPEPEIIPLEYAEKWLAWSPDGLRILAVADSLDEVEAEAKRLGHEDVIFGWVPRIGPLPNDDPRRLSLLPPGDHR
jgi:hypothetical protein